MTPGAGKSPKSEVLMNTKGSNAGSQRCSQNRQEVGRKVKLKKKEKKANTELRNRQRSYTRNVKTLKHKKN